MTLSVCEPYRKFAAVIPTNAAVYCLHSEKAYREPGRVITYEFGSELGAYEVAMRPIGVGAAEQGKESRTGA